MNLKLSGGRYNQRRTRGIAMALRRKVFRIEEMQLGGERPSEAETASPSQQQILAELAALRELVERRLDGAPDVDAAPAGPGTVESNGLRRLKDETAAIHRAISRTKREIAALHVNGLSGSESGRVYRELDAVAGGTEQATQQILAAAEDIDDAANTLSAALRHEQEHARRSGTIPPRRSPRATPVRSCSTAPSSTAMPATRRRMTSTRCSGISKQSSAVRRARHPP